MATAVDTVMTEAAEEATMVVEVAEAVVVTSVDVVETQDEMGIKAMT